MKIMIVDDEIIIRTGLAKVINWHELGLELLTPAASAEEVLERIPTERPDILLTDIRMTGKTGLELAEEARVILPNLEIIVLSGYDDFIYMQNAIRQNVSDYLLKTSRPDEIIRTVLKVKQRIEQKWAIQSKDRNKDLAEQHRVIERWVVVGDTTGVDKELINEIFLPLQDDSRTELTAPILRVVLISAEGWGPMKNSQSLLLFAIDNAVNDLLKCVTFVQKNRVVIVVKSGQTQLEQQQLRASFLKIESALKCKLWMIWGKPVNLLVDLHTSYETAELASGFKHLLNKSEWEYADIEHRKGGKTVCNYEDEKELSSILLEGDPMALKRWVQQYIQVLMADPEVTPQSVEASLQSVSFAAQRWLNRVVESIGTATTQELSLEPLHYQDELIQYDVLFQHLYSILKLYHNQLSEGQATHVFKAVAYIQEHIGDNLSLQQVASFVHLHPGHLSVVFKKESGMTFRDFVMKKKMEYAMDSLAVSPAKISEIAAGVGYDDVKYFGQIFKKYTGKTPSDYREEMQKPTRE
ncbi:MAG: response regulator [Paenibacillaceae bacterium]